MGTIKIRFLLEKYCYGSEVLCVCVRPHVLRVHRSRYAQHVNKCLLLVRCLGVELESACLRRIIAPNTGSATDPVTGDEWHFYYQRSQIHRAFLTTKNFFYFIYTFSPWVQCSFSVQDNAMI